jgi:hypothetical protein
MAALEHNSHLHPAVSRSTRRSATAGLTAAALVGFGLLSLGLAPGASAVAAPDARIVTGAGPSGASHVRGFATDGTATAPNYNAYGATFAGGVRVATADLNGDGVADVITAPGAGGSPNVKVFDGASGAVLRSFLAYGQTFAGGVFVAAGDVNGDGVADIVTAPGAGGTSNVKVFSGVDKSLLKSFTAYGPTFLGGVSVAAADVNGDGKADIITGAGPGGSPHVKVFSGTDTAVLRSFTAYDAGFLGGVWVAGGDVNNDGKADVITGAGAGGGPHVKAFSGADGALIRSFLAYPSAFHGGVRVASTDVDGDGHSDIVTGAGPGGAPTVRVFDGGDSSQVSSFAAYGSTFRGGVWVSGRAQNIAPTLTAVAPTSGVQGLTNATVTLTGTHFGLGTTASFSGTGITVNSTTVVNATTITLHVTIGATAPVGARNATVVRYEGGTATCTGCFTVTAPVVG